MINRPRPVGPVHAYQTYQVTAPAATHWRPATCDEVACDAYRRGWTTTVDESTTLGQAQAAYIRGDRTRRSREEKQPGGLTAFRFEPGQRCFAASTHRLPVGRPELFVVRGGDWRGSTGVIRRHTSPESWVDDFATHQDRIKTEIERG